MTTPSDLLFVALFAVVGPLVGYFVYWPAHRRLVEADPAWARWWLWASTIAEQWTLVGFGAALWMAHDRSWASLGLASVDGWRLWASIAVVVTLVGYYMSAARSLAGNSEAMEAVRGQLSTVRILIPRTPRELCWFGAVSLTAGFCEEFLYRGYYIWTFTPWLGWWGAAALSLVHFGVLHVYQGWNGALRTGIVGGIYTVVVATTGSLWPAIALHALTDLGSGAMAWLALRDEP